MTQQHFAAALIDRVIAIQGEVAAKSKEASSSSSSSFFERESSSREVGSGKGFKIGDLVSSSSSAPQETKQTTV